MHQPFVDVNPVLPCTAVHNLHSNLLKLLLILVLRHLSLYFTAMDVLLQSKENLVGVDRLDKIVGNLLANGLLHDVLLFTFGYHHHGRGWADLLDALQGFQSRKAWHLLVEQHQVKGTHSRRRTSPEPFLTQVYGIGTIRGGGHLIALFLQEDDMSLQQLHLIVYPQ